MATSAHRSSASFSSRVIRKQGDTDARAHVYGQAVELERFLDRAQHARRHAPRSAKIADRWQNHGEFVAAEAGDGIRLADDADKALAQFGEEQVAHVVPERIVDVLEAVQVEHEQGDRERGASPRGPLDGLLEPVVEQNAIRQPGQRVVEGLVGELILLTPPLGNIAHDRHVQRLAARTRWRRGRVRPEITSRRNAEPGSRCIARRRRGAPASSSMRYLMSPMSSEAGQSTKASGWQPNNSAAAELVTSIRPFFPITMTASKLLSNTAVIRASDRRGLSAGSAERPGAVSCR